MPTKPTELRGIALHRYLLIGMVNSAPNGVRTKTIYAKTGMTSNQLSLAAAAESTRVEKYYSGSECGYRRATPKKEVTGTATRRESIPMANLSVYMGETPTGRISL